MFHNPIARRRRRQLRNLMRGFRHALRTSKIDEFRKLESDLVNRELALVPGLAERMIFGRLCPRAEIIVRQFLLQRYAGPSLRKALFCALGGKSAAITYPLPAAWRGLLVESGMRVNHLASSLTWGATVLSRYLHGVFFIARLCAYGLFAGSGPAAPARQYACFHALHERNLPHCGNGQKGYDICSWYVGWSGRNPAVETIIHDVDNVPPIRLGNLNVEYLPEPHTRLQGIGHTVRFMRWAAPSLLFAFASMLCGRWWSALMLTEAARAAVVHLGEEDGLAADYLFHFSRAIYRPMWTYAAEAKGARVMCYFYSTYAQPRLRAKEESQVVEWGLSTWPLFLVWDNYQANKLRRDLGPETPISVVGPVHFSDLVTTVPALPEQTVAVFDIQPHRKSFTFGTSTLYEYYYAHAAVHRRFLEDIHSVLHVAGLSMALKAKRYIASNGDKCYGTLMQRLARLGDVVIAPPELAAPRLMQACIGAISSPFTSTALYFQDQGYPSVYYDPTGLIQKDDPAAHGVPILTCKAELQAWVGTLL